VRIVYGLDTVVARWVALHIPQMAHNPDFGPCVAVGIADSNETPIGGVVWHNYHPHYRSIEVSCASESSKWLTRPIISEIFRYAFDQLKVARITAITPAKPTSASRFLETFGFRPEGVIRKGLGDDDAVVWGLLDSEWKFNRFNDRRPVSRIKRRVLGNGQERAHASDANRPRRHGKRPKRVKYSDGDAAAKAEFN
jgi:RimJ/RimL family protein N-acetyltransferase